MDITKSLANVGFGALFIYNGYIVARDYLASPNIAVFSQLVKNQTSGYSVHPALLFTMSTMILVTNAIFSSLRWSSYSIFNIPLSCIAAVVVSCISIHAIFEGAKKGNWIASHLLTVMTVVSVAFPILHGSCMISSVFV